jgi:hypothetical protein
MFNNAGKLTFISVYVTAGTVRYFSTTKPNLRRKITPVPLKRKKAFLVGREP